jgi:hypothetical protein
MDKILAELSEQALRNLPWEPHILNYFSGYLFFSLRRRGHCVSKISANLECDKLAVIIEYQDKPLEVYRLTRKPRELVPAYEATQVK